MKRFGILGLAFVFVVSFSLNGFAIDVDNPIDVADGTSATVSNGEVLTSPGGFSVDVPGDEWVNSSDGTPGVQTSGGNYTITIDGTVNTYNAIGVNAQGSGNTITNNSVFTIETMMAGDGIVSGDLSTVENYGEIHSAEDGIVVGNTSSVDNYGLIDAVESGIIAGNSSFITNHEEALIESDQTEVLDPASGIHVGDNNIVTNAGSIMSYNSAGIHAGDGNLISNEDTGYIEGVFGIVAGDNNVIINNGTGEVPFGEPTDSEGVIIGEGVGIGVQYDPSMIESEEDLFSVLYENVDPELLGNTIINDGWVNLSFEGPTESFYGIFGLGNNTMINNNSTFGIIAGLGGLQGNTILNNGLAAGFATGILARNDNTVINSGYAMGFDFEGFGLSGIMAGVGNTITNMADGYIGWVDPEMETPFFTPSMIGLIAFDDNLITNSGTIVGQSAGILVTSYPLLEEFLGSPEALTLPDYLTDYVPVGNTIVNNGSIYVVSSELLRGPVSMNYGIVVDSENYWNFISEEEIGSTFFNDITNNGLITSYYNTGELMSFPGGGIYAGDFSEVTNNGVIDVTMSGIEGGDGNYIVNNGEIYSDQEEFIILEENTGIHVEDFNYVENNGLIESTYSGGIAVGYNSTVVNNGTINASEINPANGIDGQDDNIVDNYGIINATGPVIIPDIGLPLHSHGIHVLSNNIVTNYNTITALTAGIEGFGDNNLITNEEDGKIFAQDIGISVGRDDIMMVALEAESGLLGNTVINKGTIGDDPYNPSENVYNSAVVRGIIATGPVDINNSGTIHSGYAGIVTSGQGDTVINETAGKIYVYGDKFMGAPGIPVSGGDAGISVGANSFMVESLFEPFGVLVDEDTTMGVGDAQALADGIVNTVINYGIVDAFDESSTEGLTGASGIRAGYNTAITNYNLIDAYSDGIEAQDYNIVHNTYNGVIKSDRGRFGSGPVGTGIDVWDYNLVTNDGIIDAYHPPGTLPEPYNTATFGGTGISVHSHNEVTNNRRIEALNTGIAVTGSYNIIDNAAGAEIIAGDVDIPFGYGISVGLGRAVPRISLFNGYSDVRGVTDETYLRDSIRNLVTNDGYIWASDTGIAVYSNTDITNAAQSGEQDGEIHGGHTGIAAYSYNLITNNGLIHSDFLVTNATGISAYMENIITNNGTIWSETSTGISAQFHNNVFNNGTIDAATTGIYGWEYNHIENQENGVINASVGIRADIYNDVINDGMLNSATLGISAGDYNNITNTNTIKSGNQGIYVGGYNYVENSGNITGNGGIVAGYNSVVMNTVDGVIDGGENRGVRLDDEHAILINRGSISGNIGVYANSYNATIINSGTINSTGSNRLAIRTVDASEQSVTLETGSQVNGNISDNEFDDDDSITLDGSGQFDWSFNRFEYLDKTGSGTWVITGYNTAGYIGEFFDVAATEGALQVDGDIYAYEVYVWDGATLAGDGTLWVESGDTFYNGGDVSPGPVDGGIGTLTINGTFENGFCNEETDTCTSGNLNIELIDDGEVMIDELWINAETTAIFGSPGWDGGTVTAIPLNFIPEGTYTFLYSDNLEVNEDPTLIAPSALLNFTLGYDDFDMWLEVTQNSFLDIGGNQNDQNIFDALNEQDDPDAEELIEQIVQSDDPLGILQDLSPEQYPNLLDISRGGFGIYRNSFTGYMGNNHLTHAPKDTRMYASTAVYEEGPSEARIPAFENRAQGWSSWGRVLGIMGDQDSDNGIMGYDFDTYGVSFGFDNKVNDTCAFGLGFGLANSDVSFDGGQDTDMDSYFVGLYGTHSNERYYLDAALIMAFNEYDSTRNNAFVNATSSTDGNEWGLYLGGGYKMMETDSMYFMPMASIEYANVDIDGFTETGTGGPLYNISDYDTDSFVATAGFRWGGKMVSGETRFEPELRLALAHEFGDTDRDVMASFVGSSTSFVISGVEPDETSALIGLGANFFVKENTTLYVDYDGEFRDGFGGHALSAGFRYNF